MFLKQIRRVLKPIRRSFAHSRCFWHCCRNSGLEVIDIRYLSPICDSKWLLYVVDNALTLRGTLFTEICCVGDCIMRVLCKLACWKTFRGRDVSWIPRNARSDCIVAEAADLYRPWKCVMKCENLPVMRWVLIILCKLAVELFFAFLYLDGQYVYVFVRWRHCMKV